MFNPYRFPIQNIIGLNNALGDKLNTSEVAEEFDSTTSYAVGAYCLYQGVLYKFTSAHSGAWDAADVIAVSVMGEIAGGGASPYTSNPEMDGIASPGSSPEYARGNHVHPSDTGKANISEGKEWKAKTDWTTPSNVYLLGKDIWSDGTDIYYSPSNTYKLNRTTGEWSAVSGWNSLNGRNIWFKGDAYVYSYGSTQAIWKPGTSSWQSPQKQGLTNYNGIHTWTDGENYYYSYGTDHYKLQSQSEWYKVYWEQKTWQGLSSFDGENVWTDGEHIYYSYDADQYELDKNTSTWVSKTWYGDLTQPRGYAIWKANGKIYSGVPSASTYYVLDKDTSTWTACSYVVNECSSANPQDVWYDGDHTYVSNGSSIATKNSYELLTDKVIEGTLVLTPEGDIKAAGEVEDGGDNVLSEKYDANSLAFQNYRVEIPASGWSSTAVDGFYTQTITLPYPINTYKEVDINPTGASDGTDQTSAEAVAYSCLKHFKYTEGTGVTQATLYASTKPTSTFYIMVSGYYMTKNAASSGVALDITTANKLNVYDANGTKVAEFNGSATVNIYYRSKIVSVPYTGWSSVVDANGYYTQSIDLVDNYNSYDTPDIYLCGSTNDTKATAAEQAAWSLIDNAWMADSTATHTLILYAKTKPTITFYIRVKGSYIG